MLSLVVWWNKTKWKFCDKERNSKVSREYSIYYHEIFQITAVWKSIALRN